MKSFDSKILSQIRADGFGRYLTPAQAEKRRARIAIIMLIIAICCAYWLSSAGISS